MNKKLSFVTSAAALLITGVSFLRPVIAEPIYHPSGAKLTFGGMTHRHLRVPGMGNPAQIAINVNDNKDSHYEAGVSIGAGIEYDAHDGFFDLLNDLGDNEAIVPGGDDGSGEDGVDGSVSLRDIIGDAIGDLSPEKQAILQAAIDEISVEAKLISGLLVTALTGLDAKAFATLDVPVVIKNDSIGAWSFNANATVLTRLRGFTEDIPFDADIALQALEDARNLEVTDPDTDFDLTGGAFLTVRPSTGSTRFRFENDSAISTRAAKITEFSVGYSRKVWQNDENKVFVGIKPKIFDVGLSSTPIKITNIDDAKDIFDSLNNSSFSYSQEFSVDFGAIWTGPQYQVGATITNLFEPDFQYPESDLSNFTNPEIVDAIRANNTYVMERQLKLEGGYISKSGAWGVNVGLDANAVKDPMGDDFQWLSVGVGFASDNWWLPGARVGVRQNLAGSELTYITGGVTLFNVLNIDLASTTDTINVDGTTVPRGFVANLSMQFVF